MAMAEKLAIEQDCGFIMLSTMDWEARPFYEKLGYYMEYERKGFKNDSVEYMMRKDL